MKSPWISLAILGVIIHISGKAKAGFGDYLTKFDRTKKTPSYINFGKDVLSISKYPFVGALSIRYNDTKWPIPTWVCSAVLISSRFALTTASCHQFAKSFVDHFVLRFGVYRLDFGNPYHEYTVEAVIPDPDYTEVDINQHNLALIRTKSEVNFDASAKPIQLILPPRIPGTPVTLVGWGNKSCAYLPEEPYRINYLGCYKKSEWDINMRLVSNTMREYYVERYTSEDMTVMNCARSCLRRYRLVALHPDKTCYCLSAWFYIKQKLSSQGASAPDNCDVECSDQRRCGGIKGRETYISTYEIGEYMMYRMDMKKQPFMREQELTLIEDGSCPTYDKTYTAPQGVRCAWKKGVPQGPEDEGGPAILKVASQRFLFAITTPGNRQNCPINPSYVYDVQYSIDWLRKEMHETYSCTGKACVSYSAVCFTCTGDLISRCGARFNPDGMVYKLCTSESGVLYLPSCWVAMVKQRDRTIVTRGCKADVQAVVDFIIPDEPTKAYMERKCDNNSCLVSCAGNNCNNEYIDMNPPLNQQSLDITPLIIDEQARYMRTRKTTFMPTVMPTLTAHVMPRNINEPAVYKGTNTAPAYAMSYFAPLVMMLCLKTQYFR